MQMRVAIGVGALCVSLIGLAGCATPKHAQPPDALDRLDITQPQPAPGARIRPVGHIVVRNRLTVDELYAWLLGMPPMPGTPGAQMTNILPSDGSYSGAPPHKAPAATAAPDRSTAGGSPASSGASATSTPPSETTVGTSIAANRPSTSQTAPSCPADDGVRYHMVFRSGTTVILTADADPTGCQAIQLSDGRTLQASSATATGRAFWTLMAQTVHRPLLQNKGK